MKSVCPMVCQKNEKRCTKPSTNHCFKPLTKPLQTSPKLPAPLEGLTFSALKQKQAGWIQSKAFAPGKRLPIKHTIKGFACRSLPIKHIIKGFPRNITKHTKRRRPDHSTNPCGKPSFSPSPLRGTVGVNTNPFRFPSPPWGGRGVNTIKSFRSSERLPLPFPCTPVAFAFAQARANKCRCK